MRAALPYALFASISTASEDDLDAPATLVTPLPPPFAPTPQSSRKPAKSVPDRPPVLDDTRSAQLRDQLLSEIDHLQGGDSVALWAHRRMADKNTLATDDAKSVENACIWLLEIWDSPDAPTEFHGDGRASAPRTQHVQHPRRGRPLRSRQRRPMPVVSVRVTSRPKPVCRSNKAHLALVAARPCLVCQRTPCDAHHLKFAQPKALGARLATSSPCRCAARITTICTVTATSRPGGPISRSHRCRSPASSRSPVQATWASRRPTTRQWAPSPPLLSRWRHERAADRLPQMPHRDPANGFAGGAVTGQNPQAVRAAAGAAGDRFCQTRDRTAQAT